MTCIKMGSDESRFNVSLIVRDKVIRPCAQTTTFEEKGEPKWYRTEVLPLTSSGLTARPDRLLPRPTLPTERFIGSPNRRLLFYRLDLQTEGLIQLLWQTSVSVCSRSFSRWGSVDAETELCSTGENLNLLNVLFLAWSTS